MSREALVSQSQNRLLQALSADDLALLQPHLTPVTLDLRQGLEAPNRPVEYVYFLESGMASIVALAADERIEVANFGREGASGLSVILGDDRSAHECFIQIAGKGLRLSSEALREAMRSSASLQQLLLRYAQFMMIQTARTAFTNGHGKLNERLARWLLMSHDRVDGDEVPLTHEYISLMLGVRRAGVTEALHMLEGRGAIRVRRCLITVVNRGLLERCAGEFYGVPEAEYRRLITRQNPRFPQAAPTGRLPGSPQS